MRFELKISSQNVKIVTGIFTIIKTFYPHLTICGKIS